MSLQVKVITPEKVIWSDTSDQVVLPAVTGDLGILKDHAPLLTALDIGVMRLKTSGNWTSIILVEGFAEVEKNNVTVLCSSAEEANNIELNQAQVELEKATLEVDQATTKKEKIEATIELRKAKARVQAVS